MHCQRLHACACRHDFLHHSRRFVGFYPITQSASAPIVCFDAIGRLLFALMIAHLKLDDRLAVLRAHDRFRKWASLDDERVCILCKRKFNGRQVEIDRIRNREYQLRCPTDGCNSEPHLWIDAATPLVSHVAGSDWWYAAAKKDEPRAPISALRTRAQRI